MKNKAFIEERDNIALARKHHLPSKTSKIFQSCINYIVNAKIYTLSQYLKARSTVLCLSFNFSPVVFGICKNDFLAIVDNADVDTTNLICSFAWLI